LRGVLQLLKEALVYRRVVPQLLALLCQPLLALLSRRWRARLDRLPRLPSAERRL
jgi:hypothetical protein